MMRSIDALPMELLLKITSQLTREDLIGFRPCCPRMVLPLVNSLIYKELYVNVDSADDVERYSMAEQEGVATTRIRDVARSKIAQHVRVLVLRISRDYNLAAFYGKRNVEKKSKAPEVVNVTKSTLGGFFRRKSVQPVPVVEQPTMAWTPPEEKPQYAIELASALEELFRATDLVTTIRLTEPPGYNSPYDVVYPTVYARTVVRLLDALNRAELSLSVTTLELHDCPFTHLVEAGLTLNQPLALKALNKIKRLKITTRKMGYPLDNSLQAAIKRKLNNTGVDLVEVVKAASNLTGISWLPGDYDSVYKKFIVSAGQFPHLTEMELQRVYVEAAVFGPFVAEKLPLLEVCILREVRISDSGRWMDIFDIWRKKKEEMKTRGDCLKLKVLFLTSLSDKQHDVRDDDIIKLARSLCPPQKERGKVPKERAQLTAALYGKGPDLWLS